MSTPHPRIDLHAVDPAAYEPMFAMEKYVHGGTLGDDLIALVKTRVSQINGCAYCLDMHQEEGRKAGVPQRKFDVLGAWHEAPYLYTDREQAALALAEEVTEINVGGVSDETWDSAAAAFPDTEIAQLLMAISAINVWNRLAVTTHMALPDRD